MILPITLTTAGWAALINIWLAMRCGQARTKEKVSVGDGGNEFVIRRMRAHSNFVEFTPIVIILIGAIEFSKGSNTPAWLMWLAIIFIVSRIAHALGMDGGKFGVGRSVGTLTTMLTTLILGIYAIFIAYASDGQISTPSPAELNSAEDVGTG